MVLSVEDFRSSEYGQWQHQYATIRIRRTLVLGLAFDLDRAASARRVVAPLRRSSSAIGKRVADKAVVTNSWM